MAIPRYATLRAVKRLYTNVQIMLKGGDCPGWSLNQGARVLGGVCPGGTHVRGTCPGGGCPISVISVKT